MIDFTLGFPLPIPTDQIWKWMQEQELTSQIPEGDDLYLKGIPFSFKAFLRAPHAELVNIFTDHRPLSDAEIKTLQGHQSILFLTGRIKDRSAFQSVQSTIALLLQAGALGIVLEHCGSAFLREDWQDDAAGDTTAGWINWISIAGELRTFGLEIFGLADLAVACKEQEDSTEKESLLVQMADEQFLQGFSFESSSIICDDSGKEYLVSNNAKSPYPKEHELFNKQGLQRLVLKTGAAKTGL